MVFDSSAVPVPTDRIVMIIDMGHARPMWEFGRFAADAVAVYDGEPAPGWCVADQETLFWASMHDTLGEVAQSVITEPTHWMEIPDLPQVSFGEYVAIAEK